MAAAIDFLYTATCMRYKMCTSTIRPCLRDCDCGEVCGCGYRYVELTDFVPGPIVAVQSVHIADSTGTVTTVPASDYRVESSRFIPHKDGSLWPFPGQNMQTEPGGPNTWWIRVTHGRRPPEGLLIAARDLACQLIASCVPGAVCDLPANAVSVSRDGVTIRLETGLHAVPTVKMALETYGNCKGRYRLSRILDPLHYRPGVLVR
jgi:hypothetical protein